MRKSYSKDTEAQLNPRPGEGNVLTRGIIINSEKDPLGFGKLRKTRKQNFKTGDSDEKGTA